MESLEVAKAIPGSTFGQAHNSQLSVVSIKKFNGSITSSMLQYLHLFCCVHAVITSFLNSSYTIITTIILLFYYYLLLLFHILFFIYFFTQLIHLMNICYSSSKTFVLVCVCVCLNMYMIKSLIETRSQLLIIKNI